MGAVPYHIGTCPYTFSVAAFFSQSNRFITSAVKQKVWDFLQEVCPPGGRPTDKCRAIRCSRFFSDGADVLFEQDHIAAFKGDTQLARIILMIPEKF